MVLTNVAYTIEGGERGHDDALHGTGWMLYPAEMLVLIEIVTL